MNWDAITAVGQLAAAIAVIISLIYVGKQLSQNNRNQRIAAIQGTNEAFRENLALIAEHADIYIKGLNNFPNLNPVENAKFNFLLNAIFRQLEQDYYLNKECVLSDEALNKHMRLLCGLLFYPGIKNWWESRNEYFTSEFREKVELFLKNEELKKPLYGNVDNT